MRKDVRMGFAVGGVLLAVIIVAVLVIHRNKNSNNTVSSAQGTGSPAAGSPSNVENTAIDVTSPGGASPDAKSDSSPPSQKGPSPAKATPRSGDEDSATGRRWDMLFASTADDPIKAVLSSGKSSRRRNAQSGADVPVDRMTSGESRQGNDQSSGSAAPSSPGKSQSAASDPPSETSPRSTSARTHKVQPGETFVTIARAFYGDGKYFKAIEKANPNVNPRALKPGMTIQLPPASEVKRPTQAAGKSRDNSPQTRPSSVSDGTTYTVQKDDSLYKIAHKLYPGKRGVEDEIYMLNKQVIGPDSTKLKPGMVLKLPSPQTATASR